jgi:aromatic ring-opening dioxygenase LigB subunit
MSEQFDKSLVDFLREDGVRVLQGSLRSVTYSEARECGYQTVQQHAGMYKITRQCMTRHYAYIQRGKRMFRREISVVPTFKEKRTVEKS